MLDMFTGKGAPLDQDGFNGVIELMKDKAQAQGVAVPPDLERYLWTVLAVESRGFGYLNDRRPKILFERHIFHGQTGGRFSASHPDISNPATGGYKGGASEYDRLKRAMALDRAGALASASWGLGQIMGFNAAEAGYGDPDEMIEKFCASEAEQMKGFVNFIFHRPARRDAFLADDWKRFAFFYNGKDFAKNAYDVKLENAFDKFAGSDNRPRIPDRRAQAILTYLGFDPGPVDGDPGPRTIKALEAYGAPKGLTDRPKIFDQLDADFRKLTAA